MHTARKKQRLDQAMVDRGLCTSRSQAQRAILAGMVLVNGQPLHKAGSPVLASARIQLLSGPPYVSRGGQKLEHALHTFHLSVQGSVAADLGASTGGFTDCLLQQGAAKVYAVDVGSGQLAWKLRHDPRVVVMEKTNARHLTPQDFPPPFAPLDLVVVDCSFISLTKILPAAVALLRPAGRIVALVKPQFEVGKREADRGRGVVTDPQAHQRVLESLRSFVTSHTPLRWSGQTESPLLGPAGNKEFLILLEKNP